MIALITLIALVAVNASASNDETVAIKIGSTLTVYTQNTYSNGSTDVSTMTYTGADVSTLKSLEIPQDAWPLFAGNENLVFSTQGFLLAQQKKELEENYAIATEDLEWTSGQLAGYKNGFWIVLSIAIVVITILSVNLVRANKRR